MKKFITILGLAVMVLSSPIILSGCHNDKTPPKAEVSMYGDANLDGVLDTKDAVLIGRYINGDFDISLNDVAKLNADVNTDGEVNSTDFYIMFYKVGEWNIQLPYKTDILYGDVNLDGEVNQEDATKLQDYLDSPTVKPLTLNESLNADINKDCYIDENDVSLLNELLADE